MCLCVSKSVNILFFCKVLESAHGGHVLLAACPQTLGTCEEACNLRTSQLSPRSLLTLPNSWNLVWEGWTLCFVKF